MMRGGEDHLQQQHCPLYELCALLLAVLRSPAEPINVRQSPIAGRRRRVTPAGFASLLMGVALALMLCGWITFMVGFILVPWLLGIAMMLYFVAVVSSISDLGRALLFPNRSPGHFFSKVA